MAQSPDLILPVYLNQRLAFDLVAMLQGGIATVTRVSEAERETERSSAEVAGGFGLSQALSSLLKVNLSGNLAPRVKPEPSGPVPQKEFTLRRHYYSHSEICSPSGA